VPSVLILGAGTGIGRALAVEFASHRYDMVLAGRDMEEVRAVAADLNLRYGVKAYAQCFDALSFHEIESSLAACVTLAGDSLQGAIVAIGYLGDQETAAHNPHEARKIVETNYTGPVLALNFLGQHFERKGQGFLCALASVAGDRGRQSNYLYGSAKAGLAAYLQGLRNRLFRAGVRVITVKPGFVDTRMTYGRPKLSLVAQPDAVARQIYSAIQRRKDVVYVPWFWKCIMLVVRAIPERVFKRLKT